MAFRTVLLIIMLLLCMCIFSCPADEPENLSLFDPATFALPGPDFTKQDSLSSFDLSSGGNVTTISGTGSVFEQIRVNSTTGDYSESYLDIEGTDETSWRYSLYSGNDTPYYYTAIELVVTDATYLMLLTRGITTDGDVAESYFYGFDNISGNFISESLIPGSGPYQFLNGPYSQQITDSFTGDGAYIVDAGYRTGSGEAVSRINTRDLIEYLTEQDRSGENITILDTISGDSYLQSASYTMMETASLTNRYGQADTEPDHVSSTQYVDDFISGEMSMFLGSANSRSSAVHGVGGDTIDGPEYYGRAIAAGDRVSAQAEYNLSSDSRILREMYAPFEDQTPGVDEFIHLTSGADTADTIHLIGDEILSADDHSLSVEGRYDLSAPKIDRITDIEGGSSKATQSLLAGEENGLPVSLKGYLRYQASSAQPTASLQSLFYADAKRGTPVQWDSTAYRGDENVTATGSTTSGSGFIRQKAYADRSALIAE